MEACEYSKSCYKNWVRGMLAMMYIKEGLSETIEREALERKGRIKDSCCLLNFPKKKRATPNHINEGKDHDLICKLRQIRNRVVHSSTMKLNDEEFKETVGWCFDCLKSGDMKNNPGVKNAADKIGKLMMNKLKDTTLQEEYDACKIAQKLTDEKVHDLEKLVDITEEQLQKTKSQTRSATRCPLGEQGKSSGKLLKERVNFLIIRAQSLDENDPNIQDQITEIRQRLRNIKADLDNLENAKLIQQKVLSNIEKDVTDNIIVEQDQPKNFLIYIETCLDNHGNDNCIRQMFVPSTLKDTYSGTSRNNYLIGLATDDKNLTKLQQRCLQLECSSIEKEFSFYEIFCKLMKKDQPKNFLIYIETCLDNHGNDNCIRQMFVPSTLKDTYSGTSRNNYLIGLATDDDKNLTKLQQRCLQLECSSIEKEFSFYEIFCKLMKKDILLSRDLIFKNTSRNSLVYDDGSQSLGLHGYDAAPYGYFLPNFSLSLLLQCQSDEISELAPTTRHHSDSTMLGLGESSAYFIDFIPFLNQSLKTLTVLEKNMCISHCTCMKTVKQSCNVLNNSGYVITYYKHLFDLFAKESLLHYVLENNVDHLLFLPKYYSYFELELNHIHDEYVSALKRGNIYSKTIFDAWLKRLIFKSLDDKHLNMPAKSKMTDKMYDLEKVLTDIMSEPWPTVCIHERENNEFASENEENNLDRSETVQAGESSVINLNHGHQPSGTTVDLKTQHAGLWQGQSNEEENDTDPMKSIICHDNINFSQKTSTIIAPVFEEKRNEQTQEAARNVDNDHLVETDRLSNSCITNDSEIHNESITPSTHRAATIDGHIPNGASGFTNYDIAPDSGDSTKDSFRGCDIPISNPEVQNVQKTDHSEESPSTWPPQASETSNAAGIPASDLPTPEVDTADLQRFEPLMHVIDKIAGGERVPPQVTMQYELLRFCTLRSFPKHNKPYITRIAQAGFYFANTDDEVVCYCCARRKSNWRETDIPIEIHRELNPNCSFLLSNLEVNVPVRMSELLIQESNRSTSSQILENTNQTSSASTSDTISCNTSGPTNHSSTTANTSAPNVTQAISSPVVSTNSELSQNRLQSRAHGNFVMTSSASSFVQEHQSNSVTTSNGMNASPVVSSSSSRPSSQLSAPGTDTSATPKYPKYASKTARVTSYNDCGDIVIPPDSLATSGFFYAGFGDCVRCFQCGVGLRHWSEEDDPWIEHSRWSKDCLFVKQVRGQEFVNIVQMAVQYSQNQNGNDQTPVGSPTGSSSDADLERQMHTDAAQSVLEMGYTPHVIRSALRALRDGNDGRTLNATILMEKIFELEDEASANDENNQPVQGTPPNQSNAIAQAPVTVNNNTQSQRVLIDTGSASSNSARTQSALVGDKSSQASLTTNASSEATRPQNKKSQLLEQKKLKQENEQMKQQSLCTKCKQNDVCIVFLPCGHLVTCETCAPTIRYCSVEGCGKYIKGTVRTYLA